MANEKSQTGRSLQSVAGCAGALGGFLLSRYCQACMWIPLIATVIVGGLLFLTPRYRRSPMLPSIAIQSGHMFWMILGLLVAPAMVLRILPDVLILLIGITWLMLRPGLACVVFLTLYQVLSLAVNVRLASVVAVDSLACKALVAHIVLRILSILSMWLGLKVQKARRQLEETGESIDERTHA